MPISYQTLDNLKASMDFQMPEKLSSGGKLFYKNPNDNSDHVMEGEHEKEDFVIMPGRFQNQHHQWEIVPTIKPYVEEFQYKNKEQFQYKNQKQ
jgi:hypothetical protein